MTFIKTFFTVALIMCATIGFVGLIVAITFEFLGLPGAVIALLIVAPSLAAAFIEKAFK